MGISSERERLSDPVWRRWGPYLSERQWGTVREDYSGDGSAWEYLPHEMARSRAYRWGEDGIGGICDEKQRLCFAWAFWNHRDPILKERLFGLSGNEGNHGEDVKEIYYYLDNTPSHSYMRMLYKYPHDEFPYRSLTDESRRRTKREPEYELLDTGIFDGDRYFDLFIEYAKAGACDILIRLTIYNRARVAAPLTVLPHLWFRNYWSWNPTRTRPIISAQDRGLTAHHPDLEDYRLYFEGMPEPLFCENDTNGPLIFGLPHTGGSFKDGINDYVVAGLQHTVNPASAGTKSALRYPLTVEPGAAETLRFRLTAAPLPEPFASFDLAFAAAQHDADDFYAEVQTRVPDKDARLVQRQAFAGMLWSKQSFQYNVGRWLQGDPGQPAPPPQRRAVRNAGWTHMVCSDVISMPDKWEYPWFAAWDLAFHCIPFAVIDPEFAKRQLLLLTHEWYMHPNGQLPAYEWNFNDVNPPVHAWAAWRVYKIEKHATGGLGDRLFLERVFHKLLLNFTWWVNRKDEHSHNIFQGGFLGLDNIGVFDRSAALPTGGHLEQADATAWVAMYSLNLMRIALELSLENPAYQDLATKFFEHFLLIAQAMVNIGGEGVKLWDDQDGFYYDVLHTGDHEYIPLRLRSLVGIIPLFAVETLEPELLAHVPEFAARLEWVLENRPALAALVSRWEEPGKGERRLLSLVRGRRMKRILRRVFDEREFLSPYGIRALSKYYERHPYVLQTSSGSFSVTYQPAESDSGMFGGNSNWRGPIWMPVNYLLIESLQKFHHYYGDDFKIECPVGTGKMITIAEAADELAHRLTALVLRDSAGRRPVLGDSAKLQADPHFRDYIPFYEYFHGDTGRGVGASHQTGWTGLLAKLLIPKEYRRVGGE